MRTGKGRRWLLQLVAGGLGILCAPCDLQAALSCAASNVVRDGGFELASGLPVDCPDWSESSTQFGSPLCTLDLCITSNGAAPRTGEARSWFGGSVVPAAETAVVSQILSIPVATTAELRFYLYVSFVEAPFTDTFDVRVDGKTFAGFPEPASAEVGYTLRTLDLTAFADGLDHQIEFAYEKPVGGGIANYNLDDAALVLTQIPQLEDGGFEGATGSPLDSPGWLETSIEFGSPLCTVALCGTGAGTAGPRTGATWAWFGGSGVPAAESASIEQTIRVPRAAEATLETWFWLGSVEAPLTDTLIGTLDGVEFFSLTELFTPGPGYAAAPATLDALADGLPHQLRFEYTKPAGGGSANFNLDDIAIAVASCRALLLDGFETHDTSNWSAELP